MNKAASKGSIYEGQGLHLGAHVLLGVVAWWSCLRLGDSGRILLGVSLGAWIVVALVLPAVHQGWVWLCWRMELYRRWLSDRFGRERGFRLYARGFVVLALLRVASVWMVAIADRGSLGVAPWVGWLGAGLSVVPVVVLMHSVKAHFGFRRAFGIDHFDPAYRGAPLVREGLFRYTQNAMYVFAPFILLIPAALFRSQCALVLTVFNAGVLWAHYLGTERPDMRRIYG